VRTFGSPPNIRAVFGKPYDHHARSAPPDPIIRRRLSDDVQRVLFRACEINDAQIATDLLEVLEKWHGGSAERRNVPLTLALARRGVRRLKLGHS
jgi:hypothetical protein